MAVWRAPISLALVLACCSSVMEEGPARSESGSPSGSHAIAWKVDFHLSGGLRGVDRTLAISSNGELSAEDRRQSARVTAKATAAELDQIGPLVVRIKSIPDDGERFSALLDDTALPGSGLSELASALSALLNRTLSTK